MTFAEVLDFDVNFAGRLAINKQFRKPFFIT